MSHKWIIASLRIDSSISQAHKNKIIVSVEESLNDYEIPNIYHREIYMVTGKQYEQHDRSKGKSHNIQMPLIFLPDNILPE